MSYYPVLGEQGEKEAEQIIEHFKTKIKAVLDECVGELYVNCLPYIETDSWNNFRNEVAAGMKGYKSRGIYDWKDIRAKILAEHREDLINDLNQDHLKRIEELQSTIDFLRSCR